ncbi:MAG: hypothetical protein SFW36_17730 [Leptolyngbyaceae cyanobacterium bins.59]|nr:hypothetical protein [Leptolyngbyaceae cyanobacterium bins.59]
MMKFSDLTLLAGIAFLAGEQAIALPTPNSASPFSTPVVPVQMAQSVWKTFSSSSGGFSVLMPGDPNAEKQTQATPAGPIDTQMFMVDRKQDLVAYMVAYSDLPNSLVQQAQQNSTNLQTLLNGVRDGFTESIRGKVLNQRTIALNGHPGVEIYLELPGQRMARNRIYLVNKRLYQIVVVVDREKEKNLLKSIDGYLNSFRLLPQ